MEGDEGEEEMFDNVEVEDEQEWLEQVLSQEVFPLMNKVELPSFLF